MARKRSPIVYVSGRKFCHRLKVFLFLATFSGLTCFCLTFVQFNYVFVGVTSDYVSWFRKNRNISTFLRLDESTYIEGPDEIRECSVLSDGMPVVYFVTTTPGHRIERQVIRSTWGENVRPRPIFLTGIVESEKDMNFLYNESKLYNDIIIENFVDTYTNLTLKTGFILKHFLRLCPNSAYLMKTDDDVLVNTTRITEIVNKIIENNRNNSSDGFPVIGRFFEPYRPHRDPESKWYLPHWLYGRDYLPAFVSGTGYLVPGNAARKILKCASQVPLLPLEDVYFTGLVANETCHIPLEHNSNFVDVKPFFSDYCSYKKVATLHHLDAKELSNIWMDLHNREDTCRGYLSRIYNYLLG